MADENIKQVMQDAVLDADSLEKFINGSDSETVLTRLNAKYPTLQNAIKKMFESGGLPTTPFKTKAEMEASNLPSGSYATVTHDNQQELNGLYIKEGALWIKSSIISTDGGNKKFRHIDVRVKKRANITFPTGENPATDLVYKETGINDYSTLIPFYISDTDKILKVTAGRNDGYVLFVDSPATLQDGYGFNEDSPNFTRFKANTTVDIEIPKDSGYAVVSSGITSTVDRSPNELIIGSDFPLYGSDVPQNFLSSLAAPSKLSPRLSGGYFNVTETVYSHNNLPVDLSYYDPRVVDLVNGEMKNLTSSVYGTLVPSLDLELDKGSVLDFTYKPFGGVVLYELDFENNIAYPLHTDLEVSSIAKKEIYVSDSKKIVRLYTNIAHFQKVDGAVYRNDLSAIKYFKYRPLITTYAEMISDNVASSNISKTINLKKGQTLHSTQLAGLVGLTEVLEDNKLKVLISSKTAFSKDSGGMYFTAGRDCTVRLCYDPLGYTYLYDGKSNTIPEPIDSAIDRKLRAISKSNVNADFNYIPSSIDAKQYYSDVFAAHGTYILRMVDIDGVEHISISIDNGKNWSNIENTLGDISHVHFFTDGTILLGSNTKLYWTDDYQTLNESVVYDHDGSLFDPSRTTERHFFTTPNIDKPMVTPDGEIHAWGEYVLAGTPRFWYTADRGRTVKCGVKFGTTVMDGQVRKIRHVHRVVYHQKANCFYMATGDHGINGAENMLFRMNYSWSSDEWEWEFLNSGWLYKFTGIFFDDTYAYVLTDFTSVPEREKNGFYRVLPEFLGDFSKYRAICYNDIPSGALTKLFVDGAGNKILTPDGGGSTWGHVWIARGDYRFKRVNFSDGKHVGQCLGVTDNGDVYFKVFAASPGGGRDNPNGHKQNGISINMTEALRDNGITNFMFGSDNLGVVNGSSRHVAY